MRKYIYTLLFIMAISCSSPNKTEEALNMIHIDVDNTIPINFSDLFEKIELIPLETSSISMLEQKRKIEIGDHDEIIHLGLKMNINIFDKAGKFIANADKYEGRGPNQYWTVLDIVFNNHTKLIEIMCTNNRIVVFDKELNFVSQRYIENTGMSFRYAYPVDSIHYLLYPLNDQEDNGLRYYNTNNSEVEKIFYVNNEIKMDVPTYPFQMDNGKLYYTSPTLSFSTFKVNPSPCNFTLLDSLIYNTDLNRNYISNLDTEQASTYFHEQNKIPFNSGTLIGEYFLITRIQQQDVMNLVVYDRIKRNVHIYKHGEKMIPPFFKLRDHILYAYLSVDVVMEYVDESLLSENEKKKLENLNDESNPCIVKYYLKK